MKNYNKKAQLNILEMASVGVYLRKEGIKDLVELDFEDRMYIGQTKYNKKLNVQIPNGLGYMVWADGSSYNGNFSNGEYDEFGEYESSDGKKKRGVWSEGKFLYKERIEPV